MFNRLKRLKRAWDISKQAELPDVVLIPKELIGEFELVKGVHDLLYGPSYSQAEFLPDMTQEEMMQYIKEEEHGWRGFFNKIKEITK
jgi:hypothetical protein